jgi:hypothetical protein
MYPAALTFHCHVLPGVGGDPSFCMWYTVAMLFSPLYGGVAAGLGYGLAAFVKRGDNGT